MPVGTTKRVYDIWGDTVNIASRMDSTGIPGRIQVSEGSRGLLKDLYNFEYIGEKFVKGKGQLKTYLLVRNDEHKRKIIPNPKADYPPF
jgi:adenylate cyclase 9